MIIKKTFIHKVTKQFMGFDIETVFNKETKEFEHSAYVVECDSPIDYYGENSTIEDLCHVMSNIDKIISEKDFYNIVKDWELVKLKIEIID